MNFEQIRELFRNNPQMWGVVFVAAAALVAVVWWAWGGASVQVSQFFAGTCEDLSNHYCASSVQGCGATGTQDPSGSCDNPSLICCVTTSATTTPTTTPTSAPATPTPTPTDSRVDPTGNCVFRTDFNAPNGGWFCKDLQCRLDGNAGNQPPRGPASNLGVKVFREIVLTPDAGDALHIRTVLDATPRCSGGGECYPPKDPVWTCEGPMYQGRDGSDLYDCYNPIIHRTDYGPIKCCANTGLPGDCFTWNYTGAGGSPGPTTSVAPSVSVAPLQCAPSTQNIAVGESATVQATGGTGVFTWTTNGGGVQEDGGADFVAYSYSTSGSKIVTVKSGGLTAFCTVVVGATSSPTVTPTVTVGDGAIVGVKQGRNVTLGQSEFFSNISVDANETVQFRIQIQTTLVSPASVIVRDLLPTGMSYKPGTTLVNDSPVADGITTSGIPVTLTPGQELVVKWGAVADQTNFLTVGDHLLYPRTDIIAPSGVSSADMLVNITGTAESIGGVPTTTVIVGPGGISTGPGDAVILALIGSAIVTLLYTAYTRSPSFRRKEVEHIAKDRDPLDFRG